MILWDAMKIHHARAKVVPDSLRRRAAMKEFMVEELPAVA
jgi:hypothetical protein